MMALRRHYEPGMLLQVVGEVIVIAGSPNYTLNLRLGNCSKSNLL